MTYVLNNANVLPVPGRSHGETRASMPGLMQRFYAALVVSRARSAARELRVQVMEGDESAGAKKPEGT